MDELNITLTLATAGDWQGLYINGKLALEGHRIELKQVLPLILYKTITGWDSFFVEIEQNFPESIQDLYI